MDGRTNALNAPSKSDDITIISFSSTPVTSFYMSFDPFIYADSKVSVTKKLLQTTNFSLERNQSVINKNVEYVNTSSSSSYNMTVMMFVTSVNSEYICTLKSFDLLKPDVQNGLQTMISKSDLSNAKIRVPCYVPGGRAIWNVSATITDGNVEVTDIQPDGIMSSKTNSFGYKNNPLSFAPYIEIL